MEANAHNRKASALGAGIVIGWRRLFASVGYCPHPSDQAPDCAGFYTIEYREVAAVGSTQFFKATLDFSRYELILRDQHLTAIAAQP